MHSYLTVAFDSFRSCDGNMAVLCKISVLGVHTHLWSIKFWNSIYSFNQGFIFKYKLYSCLLSSAAHTVQTYSPGHALLFCSPTSPLPSDTPTPCWSHQDQLVFKNFSLTLWQIVVCAFNVFMLSVGCQILFSLDFVHVLIHCISVPEFYVFGLFLF